MKIIITGGAGYLGKNLISRFYSQHEIVCFSRDEAKHYLLKKQFPKVDFRLGDIRNFDRFRDAAKGCNCGIFAASLKQISACDENPQEAVNTIVQGALNSRRVAEDLKFQSACFISSDKACAATTLYGAAKFLAEQSFILNKSNIRLAACRYGNVTNSTGSIIPVIIDAINHGYSVPLFSDQMTRFMLSIHEAVSLIERSLACSGVTVIPEVHSFKIKDLFEIYQAKFGLKYHLSQPRIGEKIHETMICPEESTRVLKVGGDFILHPSLVYNTNYFPNKEYCSRDYVISKDELYDILAKENFYI